VPGQRAVIRRSGGATHGTLRIEASYVWVWGLEIDGMSVPGPVGVNLGGTRNYPGIKLINCYIHDTGSNGIGAWATAPDAEIYGCIIQEAGKDAGKPEPSYPYAHGIYVQSETGAKLIQDNIILDTYGFGLHVYGRSTSVRNISMVGNIVARSKYGSREIHAQGENLDNMRVSENMIYATQMAALFLSHSRNPIIEDNYIVLDGSRIPIFQPNDESSLTFRRNTLIRTVPRAGGMIQQTGVFAARNWGQNQYLGAGIQEREFQFLGSSSFTGTWDQFRSRFPALASTDSYGPLPTQTRVFVRPNQYEPGRANVAVYNWGRSGSVTVSLPGGPRGLYHVYDASRFDAGPVATTSGGVVTIPLNGELFGAYVVVPQQ
jgi:hypothetical protein